MTEKWGQIQEKGHLDRVSRELELSEFSYRGPQVSQSRTVKCFPSLNRVIYLFIHSTVNHEPYYGSCVNLILLLFTIE